MELLARVDARYAGEWIEKQRLARGLTQSQLANKIGASDGSAISRLENARPDGKTPSPKLLRGLADVFEVSEKFLLKMYGYDLSVGNNSDTANLAPVFAADLQALSPDDQHMLEAM